MSWRGVYLGVSHASHAWYLCLHSVTQKDQIWHGKGKVGVLGGQPRTPSRLHKLVARFVSDSWFFCLPCTIMHQTIYDSYIGVVLHTDKHLALFITWNFQYWQLDKSVQFERRRIDKFSVCAKGSSGATPDHWGQKSHHLPKNCVILTENLI